MNIAAQTITFAVLSAGTDANIDVKMRLQDLLEMFDDESDTKSCNSICKPEEPSSMHVWSSCKYDSSLVLNLVSLATARRFKIFRRRMIAWKIG